MNHANSGGPHLRLVSEDDRPARRSKLDGLMLAAMFLASACVSAFVLGAVARLGWELVR
jgi:hypothetical protein